VIPQNEMGVIVIFTQQAHEAGFEIISIGCDYPDAIIKKEGKTYRAEFEYRSSNFIQHKHDLRQCDLIICWIDDTPDFILPVLALSGPDWKLKDISVPDVYKAEIAYWKQRALKAEKKATIREMKKPKKIVKEDALKMILDILSDNPLASLSLIGHKIGRPKSTVGNYVNELIQSGKLDKNGHGWRVIK